MKKELLRKGMALAMSLVLAAGCIGTDTYQQAAASKAKKITVERIKKGAAVSVNILDYAAHPSETEYSVDSVEGMEKLAELVNSGTETFEDKTVKMTDNIHFDKSKKNNHVPIGNGKHPFDGNFDGNNHVVSGMQITINDSHIVQDSDNTSNISVGLFGVIGQKTEEIKNVQIKNSEVKCGKISATCNGSFDVALLIGRGHPSEVSNCHVDMTSEINLTSTRKISDIGSIIAMGSGSMIYDCTNGASIKTNNIDEVGGIVGYHVVSEIERCYNYGNITIGKDGAGIIGGIVGNGQGKVKECVNAGNLTCQYPLGSHVGGIIGNAVSVKDMYGKDKTGGTVVVNSYNTGKIIASKDALKGNITAGIAVHTAGSNIIPIYNVYNIASVLGRYSTSVSTWLYGSSINKNTLLDIRFGYWLTGTNKKGFDIYDTTKSTTVTIKNQDLHEYTPNQMQTQAFVDQLNANSVSLGYGEVWAADTDGINNGYPILKNVPYTAIAQDPDAIITDDPDQETPDTTEVAHFFTDYTRSNAATKSTVRLYANGGNVAIAGTKNKKNYKTSILYTDILASYKYSVNAKGKLSLATGKVIVGTTTTDQMPVLTKGKIVDKEAAKIATASIKHGQITVTAKSQSGKVYLWAMDTGDAGVTACIPVTVKMAPSAMQLYAVPDTDSAAANKTKAYKKDKIKAGSSTKVYLHPTYKDGKIAKKAKDATYTVSVESKALPYFSVSKIADNPYGFEISAKKLKNGKNVTGKITFTCNQNGKKVVFSATAAK